MEEQGIITKVTEPTEWVNSITLPSKTKWRSVHLSGSKGPKQSNHQRTLQSTNSGRNHPQIEQSQEVLQSRCLQRIFCIANGL